VPPVAEMRAGCVRHAAPHIANGRHIHFLLKLTIVSFNEKRMNRHEY
jgi:hypothetical protein